MERERIIRLAQNFGLSIGICATNYIYLLWAWQARPSIDWFEQLFVTVTLVGSAIGALVGNWKGAVCGLFTIPAILLLVTVLSAVSSLSEVFPMR